MSLSATRQSAQIVRHTHSFLPCLVIFLAILITHFKYLQTSSLINISGIRGLFKKYRTLIFPGQTNEARDVSFGGDVEVTFMCSRNFSIMGGILSF